MDKLVMLRSPVAILAFNRPDYLKMTLLSLAKQTERALEGRNIHLFQDGANNLISGKQYTPTSVIMQNIDNFSKIFPNGNIHLQQENLGIAKHFDFAEKLFFEDYSSDAAIFFEDDMVLSPHYLEVLDLLIDFSLRTEKVGYVAAYGNHRASLEEQKRNRETLIEMGHKWGFALTRRQWARQRPLVAEYLALIADTDYQMRNHRKIVEWMLSKGLVVPGTSQDGIKDIALVQSGAVKLNTYSCFGKYIGRKGVHSTEESYNAGGYELTQLYPEVIRNLSEPSADDLDKIIAKNRKSFADNAGKVQQIFPFYSSAAGLGGTRLS